MEQRERSWLRNSVTIAALVAIFQRKISTGYLSAICPKANLLRREEINGIERGDNYAANEQFFQIVALAELFVVENARPKSARGNLCFI